MMDARSAANAVQGRLLGENVTFTRVTTDTRALAPGDLFVALKGERFDGHDFVRAAFERGAVAAIVAEGRASPQAGTLIAVADPLAALGGLAAHWRSGFAIPLVAIVGSNGKTTVKEMLAAILRARFGDRSLATEGNFNNAIGLPLTLLRLRARHAAAAVELGMNHPGETAELAAIARPTIALINNAQREHQEFMKSVDDVAAEHATLLGAVAQNGAAVLNADDAHVGVWRAAAAQRGDIRVIDFALESAAAIRLRGSLPAHGGVLRATTPVGEASVRLHTLGRHNASNALAAMGAAIAIGIPLPAIVDGLESFRPAAGRLVALSTPAGVTVLDDTYNANPDSVRAAIDVLAAAPAPRWLVFGDMGEVGPNGPEFHREIGTYARSAGIDRVMTVGTLAVETVAAFGKRAEHFPTAEELAARAAAEAPSGATILVKGSRVMRMERVVHALTGAQSGGTH